MNPQVDTAPNPPQAMKPHSWWWWMGTRDGNDWDEDETGTTANNDDDGDGDEEMTTTITTTTGNMTMGMRWNSKQPQQDAMMGPTSVRVGEIGNK